MSLYKLKNYIFLLRLHQTTGILLVLWPAIWGILLSYKIGNFPLKITLWIILGSIFARAAGCVINDIIDKDLDAQVQRTKFRPLASAALSLKEALYALFFLAIISLYIASKLPIKALYTSLFAIIPILLYPWMKYITYWPQIFLGFTFNLSNIIGTISVTDKFELRNIASYVACIFWTLGYDTIYGHQDRKDDVKLGAKSSSILLGDNTKFYLGIFYLIFYFNLLLSGYLYNLAYSFYLLSIIPLLHIIWQISSLNINDPSDCFNKFSSNKYLGFIIALIIFISK